MQEGKNGESASVQERGILPRLKTKNSPHGTQSGCWGIYTLVAARICTEYRGHQGKSCSGLTEGVTRHNNTMGIKGGFSYNAPEHLFVKSQGSDNLDSLWMQRTVPMHVPAPVEA
eukprot:1137852-Pelagomonas_calceolata.AAC.1